MINVKEKQPERTRKERQKHNLPRLRDINRRTVYIFRSVNFNRKAYEDCTIDSIYMNGSQISREKRDPYLSSTLHLQTLLLNKGGLYNDLNLNALAWQHVKYDKIKCTNLCQVCFGLTQSAKIKSLYILTKNALSNSQFRRKRSLRVKNMITNERKIPQQKNRWLESEGV